jgi:hypothetical protein
MGGPGALIASPSKPLTAASNVHGHPHLDSNKLARSPKPARKYAGFVSKDCGGFP